MRQDNPYRHEKMLAVACRPIIVPRFARLRSKQIDDHICLSSGIQKIWSPTIISDGSIHCSDIRRGSNKMSLSWPNAVLQWHLDFSKSFLPLKYTRTWDTVFAIHSTYSVKNFISLVGCIGFYGAKSLSGHASSNFTSWHCFSCQKLITPLCSSFVSP